MNIFRSFYAKLSLLFLALILVLGGLSIAIAFNAAGHLFDEVEQLLNRKYAASIALELQPLVKDGFSETSIKDAIHYMMVLNPMVEIYLLDDEGSIKSYFTHPEETLKRFTINLNPLKEFITHDGRLPVLGDDPRTSSTQKPFSAAALKMGNEKGYVYVILRGQSYDRSVLMLRSNYFIRTGFITFTLALVATLFAGFVMFFYMTRRLRELSSAVQAFESEQLDFHVAVKGKDELAGLSRAFNKMADSIRDGVEKLKRNEQQRRALTANISHDLRSPLTSIRGQLETMLMKDNNLSEEERKEFLRSIFRNVTSFQQLVEELFELAKLENKQITPQFMHFQISELVQDVVLKLKDRSENKRISIDIFKPNRLPAVNGDIAMLERVLTNILENALIHSPYGGDIRIQLTHADDKVEIQITDSGEGISEVDLPHVFDRFYRADKSRDRNAPGTGLGLAIAKEIIEIHNGTIQAENDPHAGAVFKIQLLC